jgi:hypothetical protein
MNVVALACGFAIGGCGRKAERGRFGFGTLERKLRALNLHVIENGELMAQPPPVQVVGDEDDGPVHFNARDSLGFTRIDDQSR